MFTPSSRTSVRDRLVAMAHDDIGVVAVAATGSYATGSVDRWSDIDLFFGVGSAETPTTCLERWTASLYSDFGCVHHFDLSGGGAIYRAFLLTGGLEVDLGFIPEQMFGPIGTGRFEILKGTARAERSAQHFDADFSLGMLWHHAAKARSSIARERFWQAEYWVSQLRDRTRMLVEHRLGLPTSYAKGAESFDAATKAAFAETLVGSLAVSELDHALTALVVLAADEARRLGGPAAGTVADLLLQWGSAD